MSATRRELVQGGVAVAASAALAATGGSLIASPIARAATAGDAALLVSLLRVEQVVVVAYQRALASTVLSASTQRLLRGFLAQEHEHVRALRDRLTAVDGVAPEPPSGTLSFEHELRALRVKRNPSRLRTQRQHVSFLVDLEVVIARHYRYAIELLAGDEQLATAAEVMANEAQHATVLRELLSPGNIKRAVPSGFVAGTK